MAADENAGKFYDQSRTTAYFTDIVDALELFKSNAESHASASESIVSTANFQGDAADATKNFLKDSEQTLLEDILELQNELIQLQEDIQQKFTDEVDSAADARLEYDVIETIESDFNSLYTEFDQNCQAVEQLAERCKKYTKYYNFTGVDFTSSRTAFRDFCGANETKTGYLNAVQVALVNFDSEVVGMILDKELDIKVSALSNRVKAYLGLPTDPYANTFSREAKLRMSRNSSNVERAEQIMLNQYWTEDEAIFLAQCYKRAVEENDIDMLETLSAGLTKSKFESVMNVEDGKVSFSTKQTIGFDYDKVYALEYYLVNNLGVSEQSMMSRGLWEAAGNPIYYEGSEPLDVNISAGTRDCGISILLTVKNNGEEVDKVQSLILKEDYYEQIYKEGCSNYEILQNTYDALKDVEGIETYRSSLKFVKDIAYTVELEQCANNSDFNEKNGYESPGKHWYGSYKDHDYEFINQNPEAILEEVINGQGGTGTANGYTRMTEKEVSIYNYLYKTDREKAKDYIKLLTPKLRGEVAESIYNSMSNNFEKGLFEFGAGLESIGSGLRDVLPGQDYNKDIDGISMQSVVAGVDQRIMSDAEGAWKYVYQGAKMTGAAAPAIIVSVGTAGTGAPAVVGTLGTTALYTAISYGNTRTATLNQGYTRNTANQYATAMAAKDGAKTLVLMGTGSITTGLGRTFAWSAGKNALAFGGMTSGVEFIDQTLVSPNISYYFLKDPKSLEVDYADAAFNSLFAGAMASGTHYLNTVVGRYNSAVNQRSFDQLSAEEQDVYLKAVKNEPKITEDIKKAVRQAGGDTEGLQYRVKTAASVYEKVYLRGDECTPIKQMNDIIRYTEIQSPEKIVECTQSTLNALEAKGYQITKIKNSWLDTNNPYNGINVQLKSPNGQMVELQFHTPESFSIKNGQMHTLYEQQRVCAPGSDEYKLLKAQMYELSNGMEQPQGIDSISNYSLETVKKDSAMTVFENNREYWVDDVRATQFKDTIDTYAQRAVDSGACDSKIDFYNMYETKNYTYTDEFVSQIKEPYLKSGASSLISDRDVINAFDNPRCQSTIGRQENGNFVTSAAEDSALIYDSNGQLKATSVIEDIKGVDPGKYDAGVYQYSYDPAFVKSCEQNGLIRTVNGDNPGSNSLNIPGCQTWAGDNVGYSESELLMPSVDVKGYTSAEVFTAIENNGYFEIKNPTVVGPDGNRVTVSGTFRINKLGD